MPGNSLLAPPPDPSLRPSSSSRLSILRHHASDTQLRPSSEFQTPDSERPTITRKRSRLFQIRRSRAAPNNDEQRKSMDPGPPYLADVMSSKDPAAELRKLAASAQDGPASQESISMSSSPGVGSIKSLFNDSGSQNRTLAFLSRRQKNRKSIFPLLADRDHQSNPKSAPPTVAASPRPSTSALSSRSPWHKSGSSQSIAPPSALERTSSVISDRSNASSPPSRHPNNATRKRASTGDTGSRGSEETAPTPPFAPTTSGRNSTSTAGRSSISNLFHISQRLKQNDVFSRQTSSSNMTTPHSLSASNSMTLSREIASLPDREEGETAIQFLKRVEELTIRSLIPSILSKSTDEFHYTVMRSFMRTYVFFGDPLDMAIRKLLIEIVLPKETQQIDRLLQSFADRYQECNPGIFSSTDKVHVTTFSVLMLHTDAFNKNNKRKMSKPEYLKNLSGQGISDDVLECFYDNIVYTPFIHIDDDDDILTMRTRKTDRKTAKAAKAAKLAMKTVPNEAKKSIKEPLDPYTLIFESRLDTLRPSLKNILQLEDTYSYLGSLPFFDVRIMRNSKIGVIQIESSRSRPDAFMSASGIQNPDEARVGVVDLPINKVGLLWRKDPKKKKARSPWQEWGAILAGTGLYFFKNTGWVRDYLAQHQSWLKHGGAGTPCMFKPPLTSFTPDYMLPTDHGVALQDVAYKKHKYAFTFFRHNNSEEVFLAQDDADMNDWLARINHQAACKTAGVRQRGLIGGLYDGQTQRGLRRLDGTSSGNINETVKTATGDVTIQKSKINFGLTQEISSLKQEAIEVKLQEAEEKLANSTQGLDSHLRDARHLIILAPIQQKTREQVEIAAARINLKLKWLRVEVWRIKCHRDILEMELDEERKDFDKRQERINTKTGSIGSVSSKPTGKTKDGSINESDRAEHIETTVRRDSISSDVFDSTDTDEDESGYHTPAEASNKLRKARRASSVGTASTASLRLKKPTGTHGKSISIKSNISQVEPVAPRPSFEGISEDHDVDSEDIETPATSEKTQLTTPVSVNNLSKSLSNTFSSEKSPDTKKNRQSSTKSIRSHKVLKVRKSRQNSSSEAQAPSRNSSTTSTNGVSSAKSKEIDSSKLSAVIGLQRGHGSFTVHGKKASVVTFGGDWANNAEETLERMKAASAGSDIGRSPISRTISIADSAKDDDTIKDPGTDVSTTPTPGSPKGDSLPPPTVSDRAHSLKSQTGSANKSSQTESIHNKKQNVDEDEDADADAVEDD